MSMRRQQAFTILELMIAVAIAGVLSTLAIMNYDESIRRSNFKNMREIGAKFALLQQEHRQRFGRYASKVAANGNATIDTMVFSDLPQYQVSIRNANFRTFEATVTPVVTRNDQGRQTPDNCRTLRIVSDQGYLTYSSMDSENRDSTANCMPNG